MDGGGRERSSSPSKPSKFSVYQNPALSAVLTANSLRPSKSTFLSIFLVSTASAFAFLGFISRENGFVNKLRVKNISQEAAYFFAKVIETVVGLVFVGTISALFKAIYLRRARNIAGVSVISPSKGTKDQTCLTNRQLGLLGIRPKVEQVMSETSKKPPKSKSHLPSVSSDALVPLHPPVASSNRASRIGTDKSSSSSGNKLRSLSTPSKSPVSPSSLYLVPGPTSQLPPVQTSPGMDPLALTPWSNKGGSFTKEITTEEKLERFLADVNEKITESAGKLATPPPTINGFGITSPSTIASSGNASGATRSTPLRSVRMSPGSQKFSTPPKKGEGEIPPPMSMEEAIEAFDHLGIYPQIEQWRDHLRQWFSLVLLNPLVSKIETSHNQVMQAAAKLGISITINQVGSDLPTTGTPATVSPVDRTKEWQPTFTLDEDGLLHQLRATLVQALDVSLPKLSNIQQSPQQNPMIPIMQECVDAITEHQRLHALMKGEWVKGLLPQSSVREDYTVQRIRELADGTCLKNYEYLGNGEVYDKRNKKWTLELPTDSHLLLYLFCAFLEHPKWTLHMDPTSFIGAQSTKNPLFLGVLPPKERFPEKYIAVTSGVPSTLHPGASILVVGRQSPPIFALYWDKKLQFSLQGRTALWDSILILCHRIKYGYGGIIRGMHLGSSALCILPVLDSESED
ncbi:transmembrane protein 209 [Vitis riparia]|uniref:transmembrane protein 209 n=1 Tax=Vitis riparia TaxID=96939 RepID=UPI00155A1E42|nr:transmembrane protein 209 [Vitis riparia]